jgi:hypothetical protein
VIKLIKRAKLFVFLREHRHEIFDEEFQEQLGAIYRQSRLGQPPVPPAKLALATILQAYTGVSDDEAIEAMVMDRRWQLVLDCLEEREAPFSKGTLVNFRKALIEHELDRRLIERTVEIARRRGGFGRGRLRAALDSSPLWGAARVEDTYNLLGHALRKALGVIARQQGRGLAEVAEEAGAEVVASGAGSLKAALDLDWDDPEERIRALVRVLEALEAIEGHFTGEDGTFCPQTPEAAGSAIETARRVREQDVEEDADGTPGLRRGVARERLVSVEDPQMRHGRKSKSRRFDGYKRHVLRDLDTELVRAVGVTQANAPEASVTGDLAGDLASQEVELGELHVDRAYLSSELVRERPEHLEVYCKAWPVRNVTGLYPKTAFCLDWESNLLRCPAGVSMPFEPGVVVCFPKATCAGCPLRGRCTKSKKGGRSVSIHPDERLLAELRERQRTPEGRAKLRERIKVEHSLAHIGRWQGERARYLGKRKNLFDLRRSAVVHNLHVIARMPNEQEEATAA